MITDKSPPCHRTTPYPSLRSPGPQDGPRVHRLISRCTPLDANSLYCNLLQCTHFRDTCLTAELNGELVGFVSGYRRPDAPDTLFIWQLAVAPSQRGKGLGKVLLKALINKLGDKLSHVETTITPGNAASWAVFRSLAGDLSAGFHSSILFDRDEHFEGNHDEEHLVRIGPLNNHLVKASTGFSRPLSAGAN